MVLLRKLGLNRRCVALILIFLASTLVYTSTDALAYAADGDISATETPSPFTSQSVSDNPSTDTPSDDLANQSTHGMAPPVGLPSSPSTSTPSSDRVVIKADGFISVLAGGEEVVAHDGVEVHFQDIKIYADELRYAAGESLAYFTGHVQVEQNNQYMQGTYVEYDFKNQISRIDKAQGVITDTGLVGDIYIKGDIDTVGDDIFIHGGTATTCDLEEPHFHLEAGELEIYPGDKMVIRHVSYWEGKIPLFYWPYLVIPLGRESAFELPQVGYSPSEGWFVKMAYNYYRDAESYGKLHLDYMQKKGYGTGVSHTYADGYDTGKGEILVYRLYNPKTGITTWEGDWQHAWQLNPGLEVELGTGYWLRPEQGLANDQWDLEPRIKVKGKSETATYNISGEHRHLNYDELTMESEFDWDYRQRLGDVWQLSSKGHGLRLGPVDTRGSYLLYDHSLQRTTPRDQLQLKLQQDVHPALRGRKYTSFTWETLQRLPEVTWQSRGLSVLDGRIPVQLRAGAGYYRETYPQKPGLAGTKLQLEGGIAGKRFDWGPKAYVTYDARVGVDAYKGLSSFESGEDDIGGMHTPLDDMSRVVLLSRPRLVVRPVEPLTMEVAYTDQWVLGTSPFLFDEMKNSETLSGRLSWRTPTFGASIGSGYDFWSGTYNDLAGQVHIRPNEQYELNVWANYSIEKEAWQSARGAIHLMPRDDLFLRFASTYSFVYDSWDYLDGHMQITLPNNWRLEYIAGYSGVREEWTKSSAVLALDLHCRELRFRYDHLNSAVWVEYSINAFPKTRITMGAADQIDFKVDGLADLVSQVSRSTGGQ